MKHRRLLITATIVAFIAAFFVGLYWWAFLRHVTTRWTESVVLADGTTATAQFKHTAKVYWGLGHAGGFGGGDDHYYAEIRNAGIRYTWEGGDERPLALGLRDGRLDMAVLDRTDTLACRFRYYSSDPDHRLREITRDEFPKPLAIQNLWLSWLSSEDIERLRLMDPDDYWFRDSLTARMWLNLAQGVDYFQSQDNPPLSQSSFALSRSSTSAPVTRPYPYWGLTRRSVSKGFGPRRHHPVPHSPPPSSYSPISPPPPNPRSGQHSLPRLDRNLRRLAATTHLERRRRGIA